MLENKAILINVNDKFEFVGGIIYVWNTVQLVRINKLEEDYEL